MITVLTTGGTIDKVYFDAKSEFVIGDSLLPELLTEANIHGGYSLRELMRKDSLEINEDDRLAIVNAVQHTSATRILITHGTDTMTHTAEALKGITGKTIVLFGAMQPARMRRTDAVFNLGFAWSAVSLLPEGVYVAMNGEVFEAGAVRKNLDAKRFEKA
ncbi:asparaginase domain-containing protein [Marinobacter sp. CHS3-4]|uniref:asparaginase domain-containing protein n=1 Tax=Marinobacter sp. CHS3-4 TaxID=3045174 RepID=UPI0024B53DDE|nr:asparaginase domain-containing protein [Marinobacter sp. CHS3-4]MDI9244082.1 asparaginase domain-containing protein [Marinobacter sp. CHS3-4]